MCNFTVCNIPAQRYSSSTCLISLIKSVINITEQLCLFAAVCCIAYACGKLRVTVFAYTAVIKGITAVLILMLALGKQIIAYSIVFGVKIIFSAISLYNKAVTIFSAVGSDELSYLITRTPLASTSFSLSISKATLP